MIMLLLLMMVLMRSHYYILVFAVMLVVVFSGAVVFGPCDGINGFLMCGDIESSSLMNACREVGHKGIRRVNVQKENSRHSET